MTFVICTTDGKEVAAVQSRESAYAVMRLFKVPLIVRGSPNSFYDLIAAYSTSTYKAI